MRLHVRPALKGAMIPDYDRPGRDLPAEGRTLATWSVAWETSKLRGDILVTDLDAEGEALEAAAKADLKAIAEDRGVEVPASATKADLVSAIKGDEVPETAGNRRKPA